MNPKEGRFENDICEIEPLDEAVREWRKTGSSKSKSSDSSSGKGVVWSPSGWEKGESAVDPFGFCNCCELFCDVAVDGKEEVNGFCENILITTKGVVLAISQVFTT